MLAFIIAPLYLAVNILFMIDLLRQLSKLCGLFKKRLIRTVICILYAIPALSPLTAFLVTQEPYHRILKFTESYWLGAGMYLVMGMVFFGIIRLIVHFTVKNTRIRKIASYSAVYSAAAAIIVGSFGVFHAYDIKIHRSEFEIDKRCGISEMNIALIADFHLGYSVGYEHMRQTVDKVNAQSPDLIIIAGDIFNNEFDAVNNPDKTAEILSGLKSAYGTFACWGNHDVAAKILSGFTFKSDNLEKDKRFDDFLEKADIRLLSDESVLIDNSFYIVGRNDYSRSRKLGEDRLSPNQLLSGLDTEKPIFVIDHQPSQLEELAECGADIDFSGHTHNGQIFPANIAVKFFWENPYGVLKKHAANGKYMYSCVTSGVGVWGPAMRVGTDSEILMLKVKFKK